MDTPIRIPATPSVIENWHADEEPSWEDHNGPTEGHVYPILGRHRSVIEIRSADEARILIASGTYHGDVGGWDDRPAFRKAVSGLVRQIRAAIPAAEDEKTS